MKMKVDLERFGDMLRSCYYKILKCINVFNKMSQLLFQLPQRFKKIKTGKRATTSCESTGVNILLSQLMNFCKGKKKGCMQERSLNILKVF